MNFELEFEFVGYGDCDPVGGGGEGRPRFRNFRLFVVVVRVRRGDRTVR